MSATQHIAAVLMFWNHFAPTLASAVHRRADGSVELYDVPLTIAG